MKIHHFTGIIFSSRHRLSFLLVENVLVKKENYVFHPIDRNEQQTSEFIHSIQDEGYRMLFTCRRNSRKARSG